MKPKMMAITSVCSMFCFIYVQQQVNLSTLNPYCSIDTHNIDNTLYFFFILTVRQTD